MAQSAGHIGHRQHTGERQQGQREGGSRRRADIKGIAVLCDVADAASGEAAVKKAAEAHGAARVLINCAASVRPSASSAATGRNAGRLRARHPRNLIGTFN